MCERHSYVELQFRWNFLPLALFCHVRPQTKIAPLAFATVPCCTLRLSMLTMQHFSRPMKRGDSNTLPRVDALSHGDLRTRHSFPRSQLRDILAKPNTSLPLKPKIVLEVNYYSDKLSSKANHFLRQPGGSLVGNERRHLQDFLARAIGRGRCH